MLISKDGYFVGDEWVIRYGQSHKLKPMDFEHFMHLALEQARNAGAEVPVGAVIVDSNGQVIASAHNMREAKNDPTSHAEIEVIRSASANLESWRLQNTTLFVTLEPCLMCAGAIIEARIGRVVFGAWDSRARSTFTGVDFLRMGPQRSRPEVVGGVLGEDCVLMTTNFFQRIRDGNKS